MWESGVSTNFYGVRVPTLTWPHPGIIVSFKTTQTSGRPCVPWRPLLSAHATTISWAEVTPTYIYLEQTKTMSSFCFHGQCKQHTATPKTEQSYREPVHSHPPREETSQNNFKGRNWDFLGVNSPLTIGLAGTSFTVTVPISIHHLLSC